jgi:hypothetical protein
MDYQSCTKNENGGRSLIGAVVKGSSYQTTGRLER